MFYLVTSKDEELSGQGYRKLIASTYVGGQPQRVEVGI